MEALEDRCLLSLSAGGLSHSLGGDPLTPAGLEFRQRFKEFIYSGMTQLHAEEVAAGTADPFVYMQVGGDLPVCYYHFPVKDGSVSSLAEAIGLPPGLELAPVKVVKDTSPQYYITVTVFESDGELSGLRAEWTTYVLPKGETWPRVLVLDTATSEASLDPVHLEAEPAERFKYEWRGNLLRTEVVSEAATFSASLRVPKNSQHEMLVDRHWGQAGDVVYWRNGVEDLHLVNGLLANRPVISVAPDRVRVTDRSPWAAFAQAEPEWVLLYDERIDTAIRPWVNADDPSLPLDPVVRETLLKTKAAVFSQLEFERADGIAEGAAEPMVDFLLEKAPPALFLDFEILPEYRDEFEAAIPLPGGFDLSPVEPYEGAGSRYYLSLNVYLAAGLAPGLRAEWSVYVTKEGSSRPNFMIVDLQTSELSIDPINIITIPADVFMYESDGNALKIDIQSTDTSFQAAIPLPAQEVRKELNVSWAECNNLVYWRNGIADKVYYNDSAYADVTLVPTAGVAITDGTRFADYVRLDHIFMYEQPQNLVVSPWNNLNDLQNVVAASGRRGGKLELPLSAAVNDFFRVLGDGRAGGYRPSRFRRTMGDDLRYAAMRTVLDYDGDGDFDVADYRQFRRGPGRRLTPPSPGTTSPLTMDLDVHGQANALIDSLPVLRYHFGQWRESLVDGLLSNIVRRTGPATRRLGG
jgi:hypothetical protein